MIPIFALMSFQASWSRAESVMAVFIFQPRTWLQLFKSFLKIRKNPLCVSCLLCVDNRFVKRTLKSHLSESEDAVFKYYFGNSDPHTRPLK